MPIQRHRSNEMQTDNVSSQSVPFPQQEEISALKDQLKYQEEEISKLNAEVRVWTEEKASIENDLKKARHYHTLETKNLFDTIDALKMENNELLIKADEIKMVNINLRQENQSLKSKLFEAEENLKVAQTEMGEMLSRQKDYDKLQREQLILGELYGRIKEQLESLQNSQSFDKNNAEFDKEQSRHIEKQNEELKNKLDSKFAEVKALKARERELEQLNSEKDLVITELKQILDIAKSNYNDHLNMKNERINALTKTNIRLNQNIVHLAEQFSNVSVDRVDNSEEVKNDTSSEARTNDSVVANGINLSSEQNISDCNQLSDLSACDSYECNTLS